MKITCPTCKGQATIDIPVDEENIVNKIADDLLKDECFKTYDKEGLKSLIRPIVKYYVEKE